MQNAQAERGPAPLREAPLPRPAHLVQTDWAVAWGFSGGLQGRQGCGKGVSFMKTSAPDLGGSQR